MHVAFVIHRIHKKEMRKEEEEMKMWMRKPKKALDIYRLAISTIFVFIPVLLVALYSFILIKLKKQAHPGELSANAKEQRTRRNRNVLKMAIACHRYCVGFLSLEPLRHQRVDISLFAYGYYIFL